MTLNKKEEGVLGMKNINRNVSSVKTNISLAIILFIMP